jgi:hypothetical protein
MIFYIFLLFLFILPGLAFNLGFYGTQGSTPLILKNVSFTNQTALAFFIALFINMMLLSVDHVYSDSFILKQITTPCDSVVFLQLAYTVSYIFFTISLGFIPKLFQNRMICVGTKNFSPPELAVLIDG